jgi:hypothetical protein
MKRGLIITLIISLPIILFSQVNKKEKEFKRKHERLIKKIAQEYFKLGRFSYGKRCYAHAKRDLQKAISLNPNHSGAKRLLKTMRRGKKEKDELKEPRYTKFRIQYTERLVKLERDAAKGYDTLINWVEKNKLTHRLPDLYDKILLYDPEHEKANRYYGRKPLKEILQELSGGLKEAYVGTNVTQLKSEVERVLDLLMQKRGCKKTRFGSGGIWMESSYHKQDELKELLKIAEHTNTMFHYLLRLEDPLIRWKTSYYFFDQQKHHNLYVDKYLSSLPVSQRAIIKNHKGGCYRAISPIWAEIFKHGRKEQTIKDQVIHYTVHILIDNILGKDIPWIDEGLSFFFSMNMIGEVRTCCISPLSPPEKSKLAEWREAARRFARAGKEKEQLEQMEALFSARYRDMYLDLNIRAWSLVDYFINCHRIKFLEMLKRLKDTKPEQRLERTKEALKEVFGWPIQYMLKEWKQYIKSTY